jgi:hypothetical protein
MKSHYPGDPRGKHVRIYCTLLHSPAWRCLSWSARALFVDLRASLGKTNNGDLSATLSALKHHGWSSPATMPGALRTASTRIFGVRAGCVGSSAARVRSLYAFTDEDVLAFPAKGIDAHSADAPSHSFRIGGRSAAAQGRCGGAARQAMARKPRARARPTEKRRYRN